MNLYLLGASTAEPDPSVLGAKAAGLTQMLRAGLPVPPAFVLGTPACARYHAGGAVLDDDTRESITQGIRYLEQQTGLRFGAARRPLLVSVRSGALVSMPGMLETVLDVGLCEATLRGQLRATGDPVFAWDSYRRLIQRYAEVVEDCSPAPFAQLVEDAVRRNQVPTAAELDVAALRELADRMLDTYRTLVGSPFPQDPVAQLTGAVEGVFRSWNAPRAKEYRRLENLTGLPGTAVTVQAMVFGNKGLGSGSGVAFTRDPATGEPGTYADFLLDAQGEDVVAGRDDVEGRADGGLPPDVAQRLDEVGRALESVFADAQDFEFTVEEGTLWLLQTRDANRTPLAALRIACDLVEDGIIDPDTAVRRLRGCDLEHLVGHRLAPGPQPPPLGTAIPAGIGVVTGPVALDTATAAGYAREGRPAVLVRPEASTDDIAGLAVCGGLLTRRGARTSHAAVVARQLGVVCLVNCTELAIDTRARTIRIGDREFQEGEAITVDGGKGRIYGGALKLVEHRPTELIERVRTWRHAR